MEIGNLKINLSKLTPHKDNNNKPLANLNEPIKDTFVHSHATNDDKNKANVKIEDLSAIYLMRADRKEENFVDKIEKVINELPEGQVFAGFEQDPFEPLKEFSIRTRPAEIQPKDKDGFEILSSKTKYDADSLKLLERTSRKIKRGDTTSLLITRNEDYRNNTVVDKEEIIDNKKEMKILKKQTVTTSDKNGKVLKKEVMTQSEVEGMYDIEVQYPNGKKEQVVKSTYNSKTGITTIKKDMQSDDGTKTHFLYEDDEKGNRIVDYKITDKNGNVLMNNSQSFEVIDDNHFISSKNSYKYDIKVDNQKITVKNLNNEREVSIDFRKKCKGDKKELTKLLKKVPGEELFETVDCINKMKGAPKDKVLDSFYNPMGREITVGDDLMVFLHELGHAKDFAINDKKKSSIYSEDENVQKAYSEECKNFNEKHADTERHHIEYFSQMRGHYGGELGGLNEAVAETNALVNTYTSENVACCGPRTQYLQQYFPKTIAAINQAMRWKDDQYAIEFYGT